MSISLEAQRILNALILGSLDERGLYPYFTIDDYACFKFDTTEEADVYLKGSVHTGLNDTGWLTSPDENGNATQLDLGVTHATIYLPDDYQVRLRGMVLTGVFDFTPVLSDGTINLGC